MDRLTAMQAFAMVAECGSFTTAAERLDISRAMVTRYVESLEEWLGVRLLHRTTRRVTLTESGVQCLRYGKQMLALADEVREEMQPSDGQLHGLVRVTCSMSFGHAQMAPALTDFMQQHPRLKVELLADDGALDLVDQRIDLAIRISAEADAALIGRPIAHCESFLVASPAYLAQHTLPQKPADLEHHRCLGHTRVGRGMWRLTPTGGGDRTQEQHVPYVTWFSANEATVLAAATAAGAGIAMLPTYLVQSMIDAGSLQRVLPDWEPQRMTVFALYSSRRHQPEAVRALLDFLVKRFETTPW